MKITKLVLFITLLYVCSITYAQNAGVTKQGKVSTRRNLEYVDKDGWILPCPQLTRYGEIIHYTASMGTLGYSLNSEEALTASIKVTSAENADSVGFECATDHNFSNVVARKSHINVNAITYKDTFNTLPTIGTYYLRAYIANCPGVVYSDTVKIDFDTITFVSNGGSGTMAQQITLRGVKTALGSNTYTHTGYFAFANWSNDSDECSEHLTYSDKDTIVTNGNTTLYAQWGNYCVGIPRGAFEKGDGNINSVKDHEDNWYEVVQIGSQCWLKENMRCSSGQNYGAFTSYNTTTNTTTATTFNTPAIFANDCGTCTGINNGSTTNHNEKGDSNFIQKYGYLYTWEAAIDKHDHTTQQSTPIQGICPEGWHLPTYNEYVTMFNYVKTSLLGQTTAASPDWETSSNDNANGANTDIAVALAGGCDWKSSSVNGSAGDLNNPLRNISGFTALPAHDYNVKFWAITTHALFWTSTNDATTAASWYVGYDQKGLFYNGTGMMNKNQAARSVRCVRDAQQAVIPKVESVSCFSMKISAEVVGLNNLTTKTVTAYTNAACTEGAVAATSVTTNAANDSLFATFETLNCNTPYYVKLTVSDGSHTATAIVSDSTRDKEQAPTYCSVITKMGNEHLSAENQIDSVYDHENNAYGVVQIGNRCWLKENMRATTEPDGTNILQNSASAYSSSQPYAYYYNNDINNCKKYGCLYNFPAAMNISDSDTTLSYPHRGICPEGWHVPIDAEWTTLTTNTNVGEISGTGLGKLTSGCDWNTYGSGNASNPGNYSYADRNSTGFSALPAGDYFRNDFANIGNSTSFWSATTNNNEYALYRGLSYNSAYMDCVSDFRDHSFSIRCIRDAECEFTSAVSVTVSGNVVTIENPLANAIYTWDNGTTGTSTTYTTYPADTIYTHSVTATNTATGCTSVFTFNMCDIATSISLNENLNVAYCADQSATDAAKKVFTAFPTPAGTYPYVWKVDGVVQTSTSDTMIYTFSDATTNTHTIEVSVPGADTSSTTAVTVYALPTISVTSDNATQTICQGAAIENITFTATNGTAAIDSTANGLTLNGNVLSGTPTGDCTFNISVSSEHGCTPATQAVSITRTDTATLSVVGDKDRNVCAGSSLTIEFSSNATLTASQIPEGMSFSGTTLSGTPTATGQYTITTANLNSCGTKSITGTVTVNALPTVTIATTDSKVLICSGQDITLTATTGFKSYSWSNEGSSTNTQTVSPTTTTTYTVTVSDGTCTNSASQVITVNELPTVTISGKEEMCAGAIGNTLTVSVTPTGTYSYQWKKENADIASANNETYDVTENGSYTVVATNTSTGCSNTSSAKTVTIQNPVISSVSISATEGTSICEGSSTTLTATPSGNNGEVTYSWSTGETGSSISVATADTFTVTATVEMGNCTSTAVTASQKVTAFPYPTVTLSNNSQTICTGTAIEPITIAPYFATITSVTGLPDSVTLKENIISGTPVTAGTYTVTVSVNSPNGCGTNTGTASITVNPSHTLSVLSIPSQTVCQNDEITPITFTSTNATVSATALPDGVTMTHTDNNYTISGKPTVSGTFNFTITAVGSYDCGANLTQNGTITVKAQPDATISSNTDEFAICNGSSITLSVPNIADASYSWSDGKNTNSTNSWQVAPTSTTTYKVTVTKNGCSSESSQVVTVNALPTVSITSSEGDAVCDGATTTLTATASNCTFKWDYQNKTTQSIAPTITATTTYTVTVTDKTTGCTKSASKEITKKDNPTIELASISPVAICDGSNTTLVATPSGSYKSVSYSWSPATALNSTTAQTVTATPTTTTTYTVTATAESTNGCTQTASESVKVTVNALPNVTSISGNTSFCEGSSTTLSVPEISGATYKWSTTETTRSINVSTGGNYSVEITGSNTCKKTLGPVTVTKNSNPTITVADITLCNGAEAKFTASNVTTGATVSWSTSETGCSINNTGNLTYPNGTGTYTVTATATKDGCSASDNAIATITSPAAGSLTLTATATTICNGGTTTLTAAVTGNSGSVQSYTWYKGNTVISGATSNTYTTPELTSTTTYKCVANIKDGDCTAQTDAKTQTITVLSPDVTSVSIAASPASAAVCNGTSVTLTASAQGTGTMSYSWSTGATVNSITVTPATATTYTVTAVATSIENGVSCTATTTGSASQIVTVGNSSLDNVVIEASSNKLCPGGSVDLTAGVESYQGELSYQWYKGNTLISGAISRTYAATETGNYSCKITANDNGCKVDATTDAVTLTSTNYALTLTGPTSPVNLCGNDNATLVYNALLVDNDNDGAEVPNVTYSWSEGNVSLDGFSDTLFKSAATVAGSTYTVTVTANTANCHAQTQSISTTVKKQGTMPTARLCENITSLETKVFEGNTLKTSGYSYSWYAADNLETVLSTDQEYAPKEPGYYTCIATQTTYGCTASATGLVTNHVFTDKPCNITVPYDNEHLNENGQLMYVTDHENNNYAVVQIGDQCWLRENIRVTTSPKDSAAIRTISGIQTGESSARYKEQNGNYYYTWTAALDTFRAQTYVGLGIAPMLNATEPQRGICPEGWHIPTREEFTTLTTGNTNGDLSSGCDWRTYNSGASYGYAGNYNYENRNSTGFSANGIGWFHATVDNGTDGSNAQFVTATEYGNSARASIYCTLLTYNQTSPVISNNATGIGSKVSFLSVRCIRGGVVTPADPSEEPIPDALGVTISGPASDTLYYCTSSTSGISSTYTATATNAGDDVTYAWKVNPTAGATVTPNGNTCTINFNINSDKQRNFVVSCVATSNGKQVGASHSSLVIKTPAPYIDLCSGSERDAISCAIITKMSNVDHIKWVNGGTEITTDKNTGFALIANGTTIPYGTYTITAYGPDGLCKSTSEVDIPEPIATPCTVAQINSNENGSDSLITHVIDHEGNAYKVIEIDGHCWMRQNLRTRTSPVGEHINSYVPNKQGSYVKYTRECYIYQYGTEWDRENWGFPDTNSNIQIFGLLYNWACANDITGDPKASPYNDFRRVDFPNTQGMCPDGWHLPTATEWAALAQSIRTYYNSDYISIRLAGSCAWKPGLATWGAGYYMDPERRNTLGLSILPAGDYSGKTSQLAGQGAYFWCATSEMPSNGVYFYMNWDSGYFDLATNRDKNIGMSVRCVRND